MMGVELPIGTRFSATSRREISELIFVPIEI